MCFSNRALLDYSVHTLPRQHGQNSQRDHHKKVTVLPHTLPLKLSASRVFWSLAPLRVKDHQAATASVFNTCRLRIEASPTSVGLVFLPAISDVVRGAYDNPK